MQLKKIEKKCFLKLCEELQELACELLKAVNKKDKNNFDKINEELIDVETRILELKFLLKELGKWKSTE